MSNVRLGLPLPFRCLPTPHGRNLREVGPVGPTPGKDAQMYAVRLQLRCTKTQGVTHLRPTRFIAERPCKE